MSSDDGTESSDPHGLRFSLTEALADAGNDPAAQAEAVMRCLADQRLIHYAPEGTLSLLTISGRILVLLGLFPEIRLRELSLRLGVSEYYAGCQVTRLVQAGIVKRTRFGRSTRYEIDEDVLTKHPDITYWNTFVAERPTLTLEIGE